MFNSKFYIGVVEDRNDPEKLGRCRVRVFGIHSESKVALPTESLPWAIPIQPITSSGISGIGNTPLGAIEGSWVLLIFLDGDDLQQPAMLGTISAKPNIKFSSVAKRNQVENSDITIVRDSSGNPIYDSEGKRVQIGLKGVQGWYLGKTSERYESAGKGAGTINNYTKSNDRGGASYGVYQFASYLPREMPNGNYRPNVKNSPILDFIRNSRYKDKFNGLIPGTNAFDTVWKDIARESKSGVSNQKDLFWQDQHDFIKRKYYDVCISNVQRYGIDLLKFGIGVQDLVWSTAVQLGPHNISVFINPLKNKSQLTDIDVISLISQYKISNVNKLFKSSPASIQNSVRNRWIQEMNDLLDLTQQAANV